MNGSWTRATWWYSACRVMQRYLAAVSISSQRGSMTGRGCGTRSRSSPGTTTGGTTSRGSMSGTPLELPRMLLERAAGLVLDRTRSVCRRTALGSSGSHVTAEAFGCGNLFLTHRGRSAERWAEPNDLPRVSASTPLGGMCAPPRRATRGHRSGVSSRC